MAARSELLKSSWSAAPVLCVKGRVNRENNSFHRPFYVFDNVLTILGFRIYSEKLVIQLFHNRDCESTLWRARVKITVGLEIHGKQHTLLVREAMLSSQIENFELSVSEDRVILEKMKNNCDLCVSALFKDWEGLHLLRPFDFLRPKRSDDIVFEFSKEQVYVANRTVIDFNTSHPFDPRSLVRAFRGCASSFEVFLCFLFNTQLKEQANDFPFVVENVLYVAEHFGFDSVLSSVERFLCLRHTLSPVNKLHLASKYSLAELEVAALKELTNLQMLQCFNREPSMFSKNVLLDVLKRIKLLIKHQFYTDAEEDREDRNLLRDVLLEDYPRIELYDDYDFVPLSTWEDVIENTGYTRQPVERHYKIVIKPEDRCKPINQRCTFDTHASNMWRKLTEIVYVIHRKGVKPIRRAVTYYGQGSTQPWIDLTEPLTNINYDASPATHIDIREKLLMEHGCWWNLESEPEHKWPKKNQEVFVTITVNGTPIVFHKKKLLFHSSEFEEFLKCKSINLPSFVSLDRFLKFFDFVYDQNSEFNDEDIDDILQVAVWFKAGRVIDKAQAYLMDGHWDPVDLLKIAQEYCLEGVQASALMRLSNVNAVLQALEDVEVYDSCNAIALIHHVSLLTTKEDRKKVSEELKEIVMGLAGRVSDECDDADK